MDALETNTVEQTTDNQIDSQVNDVPAVEQVEEKGEQNVNEQEEVQGQEEVKEELPTLPENLVRFPA